MKLLLRKSICESNIEHSNNYCCSYIGLLETLLGALLPHSNRAASCEQVASGGFKAAACTSACGAKNWRPFFCQRLNGLPFPKPQWERDPRTTLAPKLEEFDQ